MFKTLAEIKDSSVATVSGKCPTSPDFIRLVNEATERLMFRGDWAGLTVPIQVCSLGGCIVFPRYVGQVRKLNLCGQPVMGRNNWYNFLQYDNPRFPDGAVDRYGYGFGLGNSTWWGNAPWGRWCGIQAYYTGGIETPVFQDIMGDGRLLRFYPIAQADVGKTVTVFGVDNYGNTLRHKLSDGTWEDGWVVTLGDPYGSTADFVRRIDRLVFEDHESTIRCYAYNASEDVLEEIGTYEGHDNNPSFTRYNLSTGPTLGTNCTSENSGCGCIKSIIALVKLRFIPARYPTDLVLVNNIGALKLMVQCCKFEEADNYASARQAEKDAIRELNLQLNDVYPDVQTPIGNGVFANTYVGTQRCF